MFSSSRSSRIHRPLKLATTLVAACLCAVPCMAHVQCDAVPGVDE